MCHRIRRAVKIRARKGRILPSAPSSMAAERRVAVLSRQFTNAVDVDIVSKTSLRDFAADEVYRFLTRDNLELRARMLDHLKVRGY